MQCAHRADDGEKAAFFRRLAEGIPEEAIATTEQTLRRFMENISASIDKS